MQFRDSHGKLAHASELDVYVEVLTDDESNDRVDPAAIPAMARPAVGDELTATLRVTSIKTLGGTSMVASESTMVDAAGAHVVTSVSTLVVRGDDS